MFNRNKSKRHDIKKTVKSAVKEEIKNTVKSTLVQDFPYGEVTGGAPYKWRNGRAPVPVYDELDGNVIWGLTARITKRFIDALKGGLCENDRQAQTEE